MNEEFEDTKGVIRIRVSKNRQHNETIIWGDDLGRDDGDVMVWDSSEDFDGYADDHNPLR